MERSTLARFVLGVALVLAGMALVEGLFFLGLRPLSPLGWPGMGMLVGAALGGMSGLAGGALTLELYYAVNFGYRHRFPEFYSNPVYGGSWIVVLAVMAAIIILVRPRLLRLAAAETELAARRLYEHVLRDNEERLRVITDNVPALVSYVDADGRYRFHNRACEDWLRLSRSDIDGRQVAEVWGAERYESFRPMLERALRGERVTHDFSVADGGVERHVLARYVPDLDPSGRVKGVFILGSEITELAAARNELHAQQARLEAAIDGSGVALWDTDLQSGRVYLSDAWAAMMGAPPGDTVTTLDELIALMHPDDVEPAKRASLEVMKGTRPVYAVEHRVRASDGEWRWILSRGRVAERDPASGRALRMIGTNVDITDRHRLEEAVQSAAQTDPLTGLANRALLGERLSRAVARCRRGGGQIALLYLDLDRFKEVNDSLGHVAGDALLKDFAARLRRSVRASDAVARFGGDEFVVLLEDVKARDNAARIAEKIVEEARQPLRIDGREIVATASIGLAYGDGSEDEDALLRRADAALYDAKAAGRNCYRLAR